MASHWQGKVRMKVRNDMELAEYNGWENKFTWLIHLHLSNEQAVMNEVVHLVAQTPNDRVAGLHVKWWVEDRVNGWLTSVSDRETSYDGQVRLLAWDLVGSALAYADWETVVLLLTGQVTTCDNPFTCTLYNSIITVSPFQQAVQLLMQGATSLFAAADAVQEWFREQVDVWVDAPVSTRQQSPAVLMLAHTLIQNTYDVIAWNHVVRSFRPE
jgi:hypothetical protein